MSDNFQDLSKIRHVQAGDPVAEIPTAQPTRALELRLKALESLVSLQSVSAESNRLVLHNVAIDPSVTERQVVYYNAGTGLFETALAAVTFAETIFNYNPTSLAIGIVLAKNGNVAEVMIGGYDSWTDDAQKTAMLESTETFQPGVPYYLSAREAGKLTKVPPALKIQVMVATDIHYIVSPSYSSPDSIEALFKTPIGMRPVGSLRALAPNYEANIIVGFDALELVDTGLNTWTSTQGSAVTTLANFGYLLADATVSVQPNAPIYLRLEVATNGAIDLASADTLADLYTSGPNLYNHVTSLTALNSNKDTVRVYTVQDKLGNVLSTLTFRFISNDRTYKRRVYLKFPDSFQGWKMVNPAITPLAAAIITNNTLTGIHLIEGSVGYETAPTVVFTGGAGTGAAATALLNEFGSIVGFTIDAPGSGYTSAPSVTFDSQVTSVAVLNGGSGATLSCTQSGGIINAVTVSAGGSGYLNPPSVEVVDSGGSGLAAQIRLVVQNGIVVQAIIVDGGQSYSTPLARVLNPGNHGYQKTIAGTFLAVVTSNAVSSIGLVDGDGGNNYPPGAKVTISGGGFSAVATATATIANGVISGFTITSGGSGYTSVPTVTVEKYDPVILLDDASTPTTAASITPTLAGMALERIDILSPGMAYNSATLLTLSGGLVDGSVAATIKPVIDIHGSITAIVIIGKGSGYVAVPTLTISNDTSALGHGLQVRVVVGSPITAAVVSSGGSGYSDKPTLTTGVPLQRIEVQAGGSGYSVAPAVNVGLPESGTQATATAYLGSTIVQVLIDSPGSGFSAPAGASVVITGGGGTGAVLVPLFSGGQLVGVQIVDGGHDFTSTPTLSITGGSGGGVAIRAVMQGSGAVVKIDLVKAGSGYTTPPLIAIAAPLSGTTAQGQSTLAGVGAVMNPTLSGYGGLRLAQAAPYGTGVPGNNLQVSGYHDDLDDSTTQTFSRTTQANFYYNLKADPNLKARYPAIPIDKCDVVLNGAELPLTVFNETTALLADPDCPVAVSRKTLFWTTFDQSGSPWDQSWSNYILDLGTGGRDHILQDTGASGMQDSWWRLWEQVYKYEPYRNQGWVHLNRTSRFYQSGKVASLSALAPLRLIDVATGIDSTSSGVPMTGQLLMVVDNQVNLISGSGIQINLVNAGETKAIFQNTTGKEVYVSSVLLQCVFQSVQQGSTAAVLNAALVTMGTQEGNYRDWIGTIDPTVSIQQGKSTRLYATGQMKELFPDDRDSYILLAPNQKLYLMVDQPAGAPITSQLVIARIKAHVF